MLECADGAKEMNSQNLLISELSKFSELKKVLAATNLNFEEIEEYAFSIGPKDSVNNSTSIKDVDICYVGLTHGDEVAGLSILNSLMEMMVEDITNLTSKMAFVLANVPAALQNRRFLERDLNRAFCVSSPKYKEEYLAMKLEPFFFRCKYIIDLHQTIQPSLTPFFIFEYYDPKQIQILSGLALNIPVIISLDTFSHEGLGIEEFVKPHGGITFTIELGRKGFDPDQIENGLKLCLEISRVIESVESNIIPQIDLTQLNNRIYTWDYVGRYDDTNSRLDDGWMNFSNVEEGQRLGISGGQIIESPSNGKIMFPKYNTFSKQVIDLFRLVKSINADEVLSYSKIINRRTDTK